MSELKHEPIVKDVGVDNDCLCIELLNGMRLVGPLRTSPVYRDVATPAGSAAHKEPRLRQMQEFAADPAL